MSIKVKLHDVIDGIEFQHEEMKSYFDKRTGVVFNVSDEDFRAAESGIPIEDYPEWQQDSIEAANEILEEEEAIIPLPTQFDIHEYSIMEKFALSIEDERICDLLYRSLKGKGAFRRFKEALRTYELDDEWYEFRDKAFKRIAVEWCDEHDVEYDEE